MPPIPDFSHLMPSKRVRTEASKILNQLMEVNKAPGSWDHNIAGRCQIGEKIMLHQYMEFIKDLLSIFQKVLMYFMTNTRDIVWGSVIANRNLSTHFWVTFKKSD